MRPEDQPRRPPGPDRVEGMVALPREEGRRPNPREVPSPWRVGLNDQLDLSIAEIAVMWILHHGTLARAPTRSLTRDIVEFYPAALDAMLRAEALRGARQPDLRLIYFKGLIVALTHSKPQMIDAIRRADRELDRGTTSTERSDASVRPSAANRLLEDQDTLAHIEVALGRSDASSH
jgi:hypothetical protein